jgi:hypothetical protein
LQLSYFYKLWRISVPITVTTLDSIVKTVLSKNQGDTCVFKQITAKHSEEHSQKTKALEDSFVEYTKKLGTAGLPPSRPVISLRNTRDNPHYYMESGRDYYYDMKVKSDGSCTHAFDGLTTVQMNRKSIKTTEIEGLPGKGGLQPIESHMHKNQFILNVSFSSTPEKAAKDVRVSVDPTVMEVHSNGTPKEVALKFSGQFDHPMNEDKNCGFCTVDKKFVETVSAKRKADQINQ